MTEQVKVFSMRVEESFYKVIEDEARRNGRSINQEILYGYEQYKLAKENFEEQNISIVENMAKEFEKEEPVYYEKPTKDVYSQKSPESTSLIVQEQAKDVEIVEPPKPVQRSKMPDTPYSVYGFMRVYEDKTELGYVGVTSVGMDQRIQQHLNRVESLRDPFLQWLKEGQDDGTLRYGELIRVEGYQKAMAEEKRLIREKKPVFNKVHNSLAKVTLETDMLKMLD